MATISPSLTFYHILIVPAVVWRVTANCLPHREFLRLSEPKAMKENGFVYSARTYTLDESRTISNVALRDEKWESLVMTGKCDWFCVMMEKVIHEALQDLLGPDTNARWIMCKSKPISILAEERDGMPFQKDHSVIEVTLPDRSQYLFDGTAPQYQRRFHHLVFVEKHKYEDNYILNIKDEGFWEPSSQQKARLQVGFETADKEYWSAALEYLRILLKQLDWNALAENTVDEIADIIHSQTLDDFKVVFESFFSPSSSDHTITWRP